MNCRVRPGQAPRPWSSASSPCRRGNGPGGYPCWQVPPSTSGRRGQARNPNCSYHPVHVSASPGLQVNGKTRECEGAILLYFFAKIKQKHYLLAKAGSDRAWQLGSVSLNRECHISVDSGRDTLCRLHEKGAFLCMNKITAVKLLRVNIGQSSPQARDT